MADTPLDKLRRMYLSDPLAVTIGEATSPHFSAASATFAGQFGFTACLVAAEAARQHFLAKGVAE